MHTILQFCQGQPDRVLQERGQRHKGPTSCARGENAPLSEASCWPPPLCHTLIPLPLAVVTEHRALLLSNAGDRKGGSSQWPLIFPPTPGLLGGILGELRMTAHNSPNPWPHHHGPRMRAPFSVTLTQGSVLQPRESGERNASFQKPESCTPEVIVQAHRVC